MKLEPLFDRVIFKEEVSEEVISEGGILMPGSSDKDDLSKGRVVSVGPGQLEDGKLIPVNVKEGDVIAYDANNALSITIDGEEFMIIESFNVLALLK